MLPRGARSLWSDVSGTARRVVAPLVRRVRTLVRPGEGRHTPADRVHLSQVDRAAVALEVLRQIERREPALPTAREPREFLVRDRAVRRPGPPDDLRTMLPAPLRGEWDHTQPDLRRVTARVAADVIVRAKFDLGEQVKLRAAYGTQRRTVAVQPVRPNGTCGITNAVRAHEVVNRYAPGLVPVMRGHGEVGPGLRYLVEDWVDGVPVANSQRMAEKMSFILEGLDRVHEGYGVHTTRASEIWPAGFREQWQSVREAELVPVDVGDWVAGLLAADKLLRVSWSHGDLVASNVLGTDDGVVLIDWEHSGERPLMHDAAKLHLFAADKDALLGTLLVEWGGSEDSGGYTPAEELALVHARFLARAPVRMAELAGHKRQGVYARQVKRQVGRLADVLELAG